MIGKKLISLSKADLYQSSDSQIVFSNDENEMFYIYLDEVPKLITALQKLAIRVITKEGGQSPTP